MKQGLSLHIGVNQPDIESAAGDWPDLRLCENDANDMAGLAQSRGFSPKCIYTKDATVENILRGIRAIASVLKPEDIFLLTYSGHGTQLDDINGDEDDGKDESWVVRDGLILDDQLKEEWKRFANGVRIVVISASCHSGTITSIKIDLNDLPGTNAFGRNSVVTTASAVISKLVVRHTLRRGSSIRTGDIAKGDDLGCTVLSISASTDDGVTTFDISPLSTARNGYFTGILLDIWKDGEFKGDYYDLFQSINIAMKDTGEQPFYRVIGAPNPSFENQSPFTI